jgi:hypothetical protein
VDILGISYWSRSEIKNKESNLNKAIEAYEEALRIFNFLEYHCHYFGMMASLEVADQNLSDFQDEEVGLSK